MVLNYQQFNKDFISIMLIKVLIVKLVFALEPVSKIKNRRTEFIPLNNLPLSIVEDEKLTDVSQEYNSEEEIKVLLEEKYKFKHDGKSTRYKVADNIRQYLVYPPNKNDDQQIAWAFRTYAARRIVGGMETSISMYPYNVAIARNGRHWCGGCIVDEQWVFSAGHCLESAFDGDVKKLTPYVVRAGSSFHNRGGYQTRINKAFFPSHYTPGNADYDFCLIRLDRPLPIGRNIAVLNLPSKDYVVKEKDILIVTGWGSTDVSGYGHIPDRLRFVPVPVMKLDDCQRSYRFYITPRMICAGYATGGKDACNHDSGGPAVRDGVLLGIVSFGGKHCGDPRSPGVYSRVSEMTEWVEQTITSNEAHTVPELRNKIEKARQREKELQRFKTRVEDEKNKIKNWLRETLKSPTFIELAKRKLKESGVIFRRSYNPETIDIATLNDNEIDEINLSNMINESIIGGEETNEAERLLRVLALRGILWNDTSDGFVRANGNEETSLEEFVAYVLQK